MKRKGLWFTVMLILFMVAAGCTPESKYNRRLKRELNSGERHDSLFMGIYIGMSDKEFYTHCWEMNREGLIRQGSSNTNVEYYMEDELKYPATMNFYPVFDSGIIVEMPVRFIYRGWSPWAKQFSSDSLQQDVLDWYEDLYGKGFMPVVHPLHGTAYVQLHGNRRITIFKGDEKYVWAVFTDMLAESMKPQSLINEGILNDDDFSESTN